MTYPDVTTPAYDEAIAQRICDLLTLGFPMARICRLPGMPSYVTVMRWRAAYPDFAVMERKAREDQADTHADRIASIAMETLAGVHKPDAARVAIDALKWTAAKLKPRAYGERVEHRLVGMSADADELSDKDLAVIARAQRPAWKHRKGEEPPSEEEARLMLGGPEGDDWREIALQQAAEYEAMPGEAIEGEATRHQEGEESAASAAARHGAAQEDDAPW